MTIYADLPRVEAPAREPRRRWSRRRMAITALATVLVLGVIGTGIGWAVYANTYQPLQPGEFGTVGGRGFSVLTDGVADTRSVLFGPPGTKGTLELSIANRSSHDVRLLGLDSSTIGAYVTAEWGPEFGPGNLAGGLPSQARPFPVTLKSEHELTIWVHVTQPKCSIHGGYGTIEQLAFRWSALGVHHEYWLPLNGEPQLPVVVCAPAKARQHLDPFFN